MQTNRIVIRATVVPIVVLASLVASQESMAQTPVPEDRTITFLVGEALRNDPRVWLADVDIATDEGIVTLSGSVTSLIQVRYAGLIAKKIHGVRGVLNRLRVQTLPRPDLDIASDVGARIEQNTASQIRNLRIRVTQGKVFLAGDATSFSVGLEAGLSASEIPGVLDIQNDIRIKPLTVRPDKLVAEEIAAAMQRDVYLTGLKIDVAVNDGAVSLSGVVGNPYQRQRAGDLAWKTANVTDVINELEINRLIDGGERGMVMAPSAVELTEDVIAQLQHDPRVDARNIQVTVRDGHVTLRGHVPSVAQRQIAEMDTRDVVGAVWVTNLLSVRTDLQDDRKVEAAIRQALSADTVLRRYLLKVQSVDGIVSLSGTVNSLFSKFHASQVAGRVPGVRAIRNEISVKLTTHFRDKTVEEQIRTRLNSNWETFHVSKRIKITVSSGRVTLKGDVDTFAQRREAGRMAAFTAGVQSVQNQVTINGVKYPWEEWNDAPNTTRPEDDGWRFRGDFFERPGIGRG
ncbi:MAG: BON domain-containing protein [Planctomycetota bacterium]|nr:BON domain-containing protein [Planctomycetota bacterium]